VGDWAAESQSKIIDMTSVTLKRERQSHCSGWTPVERVHNKAMSAMNVQAASGNNFLACRSASELMKELGFGP